MSSNDQLRSDLGIFAFVAPAWRGKRSAFVLLEYLKLCILALNTKKCRYDFGHDLRKPPLKETWVSTFICIVQITAYLPLAWPLGARKALLLFLLRSEFIFKGRHSDL